LIFINIAGFSQAEHSLFLQDQFNGGIRFAGFGIGYFGISLATAERYIEP
jgi:hypothetical protein